MEIKNSIVFGIISSHECPTGGRGVLGVMPDFGPIDMKFGMEVEFDILNDCLLYTSPSPRDRTRSRMPSSA